MQNFETKLLVIGYGNTLRSDDGVGPRVSDRVAAMHLPGVKTITCDLLAPELADPVSQAETVVFVDASIDAPMKQGVLMRELAPAESSQIMAHAADPRTLLALARDVFGHTPHAWWLTIPAQHLGIGETFSEPARLGVEDAIRRIQALATAPAS